MFYQDQEPTNIPPNIDTNVSGISHAYDTTTPYNAGQSHHDPDWISPSLPPGNYRNDRTPFRTTPSGTEPRSTPFRTTPSGNDTTRTHSSVYPTVTAYTIHTLYKAKDFRSSPKPSGSSDPGKTSPHPKLSG